MNFDTLNQIIDRYKTTFSTIHDREIYKWRAVQHFQNHWNPDADDFAAMLEESISPTRNLMDSGNYFPRRMLFNYARVEPAALRQVMLDLFDEDADLVSRMHAFQKGIRGINEVHYPGKHHYQDHRAIMVYLTLRYPERYFFYKFTMFKAFAVMVDYPAEVVKGRTATVLHYEQLCRIIRPVLAADNDLIRLHQGRLRRHDFADTALNLLTQDVIYAATLYLRNEIDTRKKQLRIDVVTQHLLARDYTPTLRGRVVNWLENQQTAKAVGDEGELMILEYEQQQLLDWGIRDLAPEHVAKTKGDGLGYDILSYTKDRREKYIEVKATRGVYNATFYISAPELKKSTEKPDQYFLYRLFDMNIQQRTARLIVRPGSLQALCTQPSNYVVLLDATEPVAPVEIK